MCSSGDSTGVKPEDQKALYDKVIKERPSTILSLEHEVYGMFLLCFSLSPPHQREFLAECHLCRFQIPACNFFFRLLFVVVWCDFILFFYRHEVLPYAIKELQKAGYNLVTVAECLGQQPYHSQGPPSTRDVCV